MPKVYSLLAQTFIFVLFSLRLGMLGGEEGWERASISDIPSYLVVTTCLYRLPT